MNDVFHMVQFDLDALVLMRLGRRRGLPRHHVDLGYLAHCQLGETFGTEAPCPFALAPGGEHRDRASHRQRSVPVLAYSTLAAEALRQLAQEGALPEAYEGIEWASLKSKPMPDQWASGRHLRFHLRACPVVRMAASGAHHRKGAEVDVFLRECWKRPSEQIDREPVYRGWLSEQLERRGARLVDARLSAMRLMPVTRRNHDRERKSRVMRRPDVTFEGLLEVTDSGPFVQGLRRGIGRHRSFGYGMLLVKPA